jgi:hypothetical protein
VDNPQKNASKGRRRVQQGTNVTLVGPSTIDATGPFKKPQKASSENANSHLVTLRVPKVIYEKIEQLTEKYKLSLTGCFVSTLTVYLCILGKYNRRHLQHIFEEADMQGVVFTEMLNSKYTDIRPALTELTAMGLIGEIATKERPGITLIRYAFTDLGLGVYAILQEIGLLKGPNEEKDSD